MNFDYIRHLILKYLKGKSSAAENSLLERWLDTLASKSSSMTQELEEQDRQAIRNRMLQGVKEKYRSRTTTAHTTLSFPWIKAAAVLIPLFIAFGYGIYLANTADEITIVTAIGETKEIVLPDDSRIVLKPNSALHYSLTFGKARNVSLSGEAFFSVTRDTLRKFTVHTKDLAIVVLGTSFHVKAYDALPVTAVTVKTGKVSVTHEEKVLGILLPQDKLLYDAKTASAVIRKTNLTDVLHHAWSFEDTPLPEVLTTLAYYYPVTFSGVQPDSIYLSGSFNKTMTLDQVTEALNSILERYHIKITKEAPKQYRVEQTHAEHP